MGLFDDKNPKKDSKNTTVSAGSTVGNYSVSSPHSYSFTINTSTGYNSFAMGNSCTDDMPQIKENIEESTERDHITFVDEYNNY